VNAALGVAEGDIALLAVGGAALVDAKSETNALGDGELAGEALRVPGESDAVDGAEAEGQGVVEGEAAPVGDTIALLDAETVALAVSEDKSDGVLSEVCDWLTEGEEQTVGEAVAAMVLLTQALLDAEADSEGLRLALGVPDELRLPVGVAESATLRVTEGDAEGQGDADWEPRALLDAIEVEDGVTETEAECEAEPLALAHPESLRRLD
jgi:hypothetical protein